MNTCAPAQGGVCLTTTFYIFCSRSFLSLHTPFSLYAMQCLTVCSLLYTYVVHLELCVCGRMTRTCAAWARTHEGHREDLAESQWDPMLVVRSGFKSVCHIRGFLLRPLVCECVCVCVDVAES